MTRKLFCEINPTCYKISEKKENIKRKVKDILSNEKIANNKSDDKLPEIIKSHTSILLRKLHGVDMKLQKNKKKNIEIACSKINGIIIKPGETFSFWHLVGKPDKRNGYLDGLVITRQGLKSGIGGGLCQLANLIHYLVLNSPLEVMELHHHSDALFPDDRRRVPFGTGVSISYSILDYRFKNTLDNDVQILVWVSDDTLCGELRSIKELDTRYKLVEEDSHYKCEDNIFYRNSKVYKITIDKKSNKEINKELILDNHSKVVYDYDLIPKDEIRR